jgi:phospholipid/cholesterol/gamma-HCH transport system substrate-binding protein
LKFAKEVKIGAIVTFGIIALIWGINFLKGTDLLSSRNKYYVVYERIDQLTVSNPVLLNGLTVGQVKDMQLLPHRGNRIMITLQIDNELRVPRNTIARIVSTDLLGAKAIDLIIKDTTQIAMAQPGDTLFSDVQLSLADEVNKQVAPIKEKAESLLASVDSVVTVLQQVFNAESRENISSSFKSISNTLKSLESTSYTLDTLLDSETYRIRVIFSNVESISSNLRDNNEQIKNIIHNFSAISDTIAQANIAGTIFKTNEVLKATSEIMEKVQRGEGSLGMLINDEKLYKKLTDTAADLDNLMQDIKANPKRYLNFSLISTGR